MFRSSLPKNSNGRALGQWLWEYRHVLNNDAPRPKKVELKRPSFEAVREMMEEEGLEMRNRNTGIALAFYNPVSLILAAHSRRLSSASMVLAAGMRV